MLGHGQVEVAGVELHVDLTIDAGFAFLVEILTYHTHLGDGGEMRERVHPENVSRTDD